jgi:hypothetical protein
LPASQRAAIVKTQKLKHPIYNKVTKRFRWVGEGLIPEHLTIAKGQVVKVETFWGERKMARFKEDYTTYYLEGECELVDEDKFFIYNGEQHLMNKHGIKRLKVYKRWKQKVDNS